MMFYCLENKKNASDLQESLVVIPNRKLQGTLVVEQAKGFGRSYFEYMEFMEKAKKYVDADQLKILEDKASELYEAKKGERAIDFTCPDANGKMHSLSDYKGKSGSGGCVGNVVWTLSGRITAFEEIGESDGR